MKFHRAEIRNAENGYIVSVTHKGEEKAGKRGDSMPTPYKDKEHVANSDGHALKIISKAMAGDHKLLGEKPKKFGKKKATKR